MSNNYYICPKPFDSRGDSLLGWAREAIQQGNTYLRLQAAYPYISEGMSLINGDYQRGKVATLSDAKTELTVRNLRELVASIANIRIIPAFKSEAAEFSDTQMLLNKLYMAWQTSTFSDRSIRKGWQWAVGGGTGYLGIRWEPHHYSRGKGELILDAYGPTSVIPVGMPKSHDLQKAYAVALKVETPYHELARRYPDMVDLIRPSRDHAIGGGNVVSAAVKYATAALRKFGPGHAQESESAPWAMCDVYHIYIDDDSVNTTGSPILMGDPGTSWEYLVPYVGQEIAVERDANGHATRTRPANTEDARLYPNRRKIVCTDDAVLNPDPMRQVNEYWHGMVPAVQLRADDWPWAFLGFPLSRSGASLEKANIELMRGMVDMMNNRLSPSRAYDRNTMSQALAQSINTRIPNQVIGLDMSLGGEQMKPLIPPQYLDPPAVIPEIMEANERRMNHQMGVGEAFALAQARQLPSGDSFERIMDSLGPIIKDQSRNMESSICGLGTMWMHGVFQFYHADRLMEVLGPQGVVEETFQFRSADLIPENVPGVLPDDPQYQKARKHAGNFTFAITPYSLHEINSVTRKLFHLQLMRAGFPIDWWTLAEVFDIRNFGPKPMIDDPNEPGTKREAQTIMECWLAQQEMMSRMQAANAAANGKPGPGGPAGGPPAMGHQEGRPPTGQNPPAMEQKSDGRAIIRESKH